MKDRAGGGRQGKEPNRVKNRSEKREGPGWRGDQRLFEKKSFFKQPKT